MVNSKKIRRTASAILVLILAISGGAWAAAGNFDITNVKATFGSWKGEYDSENEFWMFEHKDLVSFFFIELGDVDEGGKYNEYLDNLTEEDWLDKDFVWTKISSKEKFSDGFLITGMSIDYTNEDAEAAPTFVLVRAFKNTAIVCTGDAETVKILNEAIAFCKTLK
jgi:hypothetical protein